MSDFLGSREAGAILCAAGGDTPDEHDSHEVTEMSVATITECPVCAGDVEVAGDVIVGELLDCGDCGAELEVRALSPELRLDEAPMAAEDWGE